ncbi:hypothetical protein ACQ4PT_041967 [Festuca glaucescens]
MAVEVVMKANLAARVHLVAHVLRRTVLRLPFLLLVMLRWFLLTASLAAQMRRCLEIRMGKCPLLSDVLPLPFVDGEEASLNHRKRKIIHNFQVKRARVCLSGPPFREKCIALLKALSPERSYYGVHAYKCEKCDALFWYLKRSKRASVGKGRLPVFFEANMLAYHFFNQNALRSETYQGITDGIGEDLYVVEFQKRGLRHTHTLIWFKRNTKEPSSGLIDSFISAKLPDPEKDPLRYVLVDKFMVHGPCVDLNTNFPCMKGGVCSKRFPKAYNDEALVDVKGFLVYRRRDDGRFVLRNRGAVKLTNKWVVLHNLGHDVAHVRFQAAPDFVLVDAAGLPLDRNEVEEYIKFRYLSAYEACWRMFAYDIQGRQPSVERLIVHLPGMNKIIFHEDDSLASLVWNKIKIKRKISNRIGRIYHVHPGTGELFFLRMLFLVVAGATCFEDLRRYWSSMDEDISYKITTSLGGYVMPDVYIQDELLKELSVMFARNRSCLASFSVSSRCVPANRGAYNRLIAKETQYDLEELRVQGEILCGKLNAGQRLIFSQVMNAIDTDTPKVYFVSSHGGTGKTFLWNCIVTVLRSERRIVLDVASSRVASLLLPNGRTAHSRFRIPLDVNDKTQCNILRGSTMAALLEETSLILWDEAPMTIRYCFEALDRTLRDVISPNDSARSSLPFGGKTVILGGDFRQVLPVIEGGSRNEIIDASLIASPLWQHVTLLSLKENMHLKRPDLSSADREEFSTFVQWVLDVGNSDIPGYANDGEDSGSWITIPDDLVLHPASCNADVAIQSVYDSLFFNYASADYLAQRAIMCPTNTVVDEINDSVFERVSGCSRRYLSCDSISKSTDHVSDADLLYPPEFCHSVTINNVPQHELNLKVGVPVMLLKNTNQSLGLCNGLLAFKSTSIIRWHVNVPILEIDVVRERSKHLPWHIKLHSGNQSCSEPTVSSIAEIATFEPNYIMKSIMEGLVPGNSVDPDQLKEGSAYTIDRFDIYDPKKSYSEHAIVTLWGEEADLFDADGLMEASNEDPVIVLFVGMTVSQYSGLLAFKSTSVTRWDVNVPIPEIAIFRERSKHLPWRIELHS